MLETGNSEINVDQLMHEIRETVARQKLQRAGENVPASLTLFSPIGSYGSHAPVETSPLSLQPEFHPSPDRQYHVNDLLKYHGADFVRNAYRAILNREPDAAGWAHHLENLASGRFNKIDVLASLRYSPEGERARVKIDGLTWPAALRRMGRAPVVGYLIQLLIALGRLPVLLQHQRQSEFYLLAQQQQIVDHANQVRKQLAEALTRLSAQSNASAEKAADQQQLIELLSQQQQDVASRLSEFRDAVETRLTATREHVDESAAVLTRQMEERVEAVTQQVNQNAARLTMQAAESAAALTQQISESAAALARQISESAATLTQQLEGQIQQLLQRQQDLTSQVEEQAERLLQRQQQTQTELVMQERRLTMLLEKAREQPPGVFNQPLVQQLIDEEDHLLDALYAAFEDHFRGEREEVKRRLRVYLPILKEAKISEGVLDIGCGRGEWLELLKGTGIKGRGVDRNRVFIDQCRRLDLDVTEEDALVYLKGLPEQSLNAVTSFHLVEHLPFETLIKLLDESVRVLKSGGLLILETPDPQNFIVGSYNFYADPTHRNPIPSPTLQFLLESRGLSRIKVMKLRPWDAAKIEGDSEIIKRFNEYFYSAPDYGIIGWKV
jgi:O-antigen chain-terminating methyltransferase